MSHPADNLTYTVPLHLLGIDTNAKTVKGAVKGFMTGILYLSPADVNDAGINLCPMAEIARCKAPCLFTAGRGAMSPVQAARRNKTHYYLHDPESFMRHIARDIHRLLGKAARADLTPLVRLNGTSDIRWELVPVIVTPELAKRIGRPAGTYRNIMALFPEVQFYDYTKLTNRRGVPANYDLTFSYSGVPEYARYVRKAISQGMRIAVVFRDRATAEQAIEHGLHGHPCVDGDDSDVRHLDPHGVYVALYAKGRAKTDTSGFVVG